MRALRTLDDPDSSLPFIRQILSTLRTNVGADSTVLGFIGTPWTLAAYAMEGAADRCALPRYRAARDRTLGCNLAYFATYGLVMLSCTLNFPRRRYILGCAISVQPGSPAAPSLHSDVPQTLKHEGSPLSPDVL